VNTDGLPEAQGGVSAHQTGLWRSRRILIYVALAALAAVAAGTAYLCWAKGKLRFACVREGALYRCAQPSIRQLARIVGEHRIRTIVNLRRSRSIERDSRALDEMAFAKERGIRFVNIEYDHAEAQSQIKSF